MGQIGAWEGIAAQLYHDIPRIHTVLAQWSSCMVYIFLLKRKSGHIRLVGVGAIFLIVQDLLMKCKDMVSVYFWIPSMSMAALSMYCMISFTCEADRKKKIYCTSCAFLLSELSASFEWGIYYHLRYITGIQSAILKYGLLIGVYMVIIGGTWFAEKSLLKRGSDFYISRKEMMVVGAIVVFTFLFSNLSYVYPNTPFSSKSFYDAFKLRSFIDMLGYVWVIAFQIYTREQVLLAESYAMNAALRSQYERYLHHQESMEMVNMKYHDLKHQIRALRMETDEQKKNAWLDSLEDELDAYKNVVDSGNKMLDVLLESKLIRARKWHIEMTYVIDGKLLDFMHVTDICTIFGNALDNAIEAEMMETNEEQRSINVSVSAQRQFVFIRVENYVSKPVILSNGFPKTTKSDKKNHGYGLKSIRNSSEKYHGNMTIMMNKNWFVLNVMIPMQ